jgi:hypothetical protein
VPPIVEQLISETPDEDDFRNLLRRLEGSLDGIQLHVELDGVIRSLAPENWNWRQVQNHVKPLLELQLVRAEYSGSFYQLYLALQSQSKVAQFVPNADVADILTLKKLLYNLDLDSASAQRCKDAMNGFLDGSCNIDGLVEVPISTDKISEPAKYIEMLSKDFDVSASLAQGAE